jgi:hypothetical protein
VRDTDPRVKLLTNFSGDQDDNALSHRIAKAQMAAGADVIFTMLNSGRDGVTQACREAGTRQIGNVIDWTTVDPQVFVASAWADVGIGAFLAVKDMQERGAPGPGIRKIGLSDPAAVRLTMGQGVAPRCARARGQGVGCHRLGAAQGSRHYEGRSFLPDRMVRRRCRPTSHPFMAAAASVPVAPLTAFRHGLGAGGGTGPGPLEVVAAQPAGDVHHLADKVQARRVLHSMVCWDSTLVSTPPSVTSAFL